MPRQTAHAIAAFKMKFTTKAPIGCSTKR